MEAIVKTLNPLVQKFKNVLLLFFILRIGKKFHRILKIRGLIGAIRYGFALLAQKVITMARKTVPGADSLVQKEVEKSIAAIHKGMCPDIPGQQKYLSLPVNGMKINDVTVELDRYTKMGKVDWRSGKVSGAIYHGGQDLVRLTTDAFSKFTISNPLHPEIFAGVRKMEAEIVSMVLNMYHATEEAGGSVTSGGSESIMMAIKAHRDWALDKKGITKPEMVVPVSAHAAFDKGAHYFGIELIHIPVDPITGCADIKAMANAITGNTIMIAGSTPSFPHGSIDNIPEMAKLALKHKIGLHVDSCLGGFLVPFMKDAGVKGVTSISCDTHKYGFAPKGTSVVMYHSRALRKYQYFLATDWPGGVYGSPTMAGSRPGSLSAGCWATMLYMGFGGYVEATKKIISTARSIKKGIQAIDELQVIGEPLLSVVAFTSKAPIKIYAVADLLSRKEYHLNVLQFPPSIHIACTMLTPQLVDQLIADLRDIVETLKKDPKAGDGEKAAIYGTAASVPDRNIIGDVVCGFLDGLTKI